MYRYTSDQQSYTKYLFIVNYQCNTFNGIQIILKIIYKFLIDKITLIVL